MPTKKDVQFDKEAVLITLDQMQQALEVLGTTINRLQRYVKKYASETTTELNSKHEAVISKKTIMEKSLH